MKKICKKINIFIIISIMFSVVISSFVLASSYDWPNLLVDPKSDAMGEVYYDEENFGLTALKDYVSENDFNLATYYVSEYRKGDKSKEEPLRELFTKYGFNEIDLILNYLLVENQVEHIASYAVDYLGKQITYYPINGLSTTIDSNQNLAINVLWQRFLYYAPEEVCKSIKSIHVELNRDDDNMAILRRNSIDVDSWDLHIDLRLMDVGKEEELTDNFTYIITYYYILANNQIEFFSPKKNNYTYDGYTYKDDSYINLFYRRFWRGRREETTNSDQYELYKKEFFNEKSSRTVYDDMAVSFNNYVKGGYMKRYLGFKADKNNFFNEFDFFKELAVCLRLKLNIPLS